MVQNPIVALAALLTNEMLNQEERIAHLNDLLTEANEFNRQLEQKVVDLNARLEENASYHSEATAAIKAENVRLRNQLDDWRARIENVGHVASSNNDLRAQVRKLQAENYKLRFGGHTTEEVAQAYMRNQGAETWAQGAPAKLNTLNVIREITGWGLREAKDWCEAFMSTHVPTLPDKVEAKVTEEESGPRTIRSMPVPPVVGEDGTLSVPSSYKEKRPIEVAVAYG